MRDPLVTHLLTMKIRNWSIFLFVVLYHILIIALIPVAVAVFSWTAFWLFLVSYIIGGISITAGYHRLFAHKAYTAKPIYEWLVLIGSLFAFEMSALKWSFDHRLHHNHVDTDSDPYSINKGFWYAHILWLFDYDRKFDPKLVPDLLKNPRVAFQDKYYIPLAIIANLMLIGVASIFIDPMAAFYYGFLLRMAMVHHCTWFINSLCHTFGSKTYSRELTAVDNAAMALLTFGEGYHNYHHAFAADYRNGIRWYHFDPTKWVIWLSSKLGFTKNLRSVNSVVLLKSLVQKDRKIILDRLSEEVDEIASEWREKVEQLSSKFENISLNLNNKVRELKNVSDSQKLPLEEEVKQLKSHLDHTWKEWLELTQNATKQFKLAHSH